MNTIEKIRQENMKTDVPELNIGDTVQVDVIIHEGDKDRVQAFTGTIIAKNGTGISQSVTLRRVTAGQGVERVLPIHSPRIAGFKVIRSGRVRRAKLYYLRGQVGKAAKVKAKRIN